MFHSVLCHVHAYVGHTHVGLPVLLTVEEEAVLCGSAILAAAATGIKVRRSTINS